MKNLKLFLVFFFQRLRIDIIRREWDFSHMCDMYYNKKICFILAGVEGVGVASAFV